MGIRSHRQRIDVETMIWLAGDGAKSGDVDWDLCPFKDGTRRGGQVVGALLPTLNRRVEIEVVESFSNMEIIDCKAGKRKAQKDDLADGYEEEDGNARRNSLARDSRSCVVIVKGKFPGVGVQGKNRASKQPEVENGGQQKALLAGTILKA